MNDITELDISEQEFLGSDVSESDVVELDIGKFHSTFPSRRPGATNKISVPFAALSLPPAPASTPLRSPSPAPEAEPKPAQIALKSHSHHPLIVSSRENIGLPNYAYHPHFVRPGTSRNQVENKQLSSLPGVPGTYLCPPTPYGEASSGPYIAITKGLYVGIFTNW